MSKARLKAGGWQIGTDTVDATAAEIDAAAGTGISQAELAVLNAVTPGAVAASKALVVDASRDLATLGNVTLDGNLVSGSTTLSEAELGVLDAVTPGTVAASKALVVDASKDLASLNDVTAAGNVTAAGLITTANLGTPGSGVTAVEYGDGFNHVSELTLAVTNQAIAGGAALGVGNAIYTLPAGACQILGAHQAPTFTAVDGNIDADTPDVGLGTVIASGAIATLTTATMENIITGQTATNCTGTATGATFGGGPTAAASLEILVGASHDIFLNWAFNWTAGGEGATATIGGTVRLFWRFLG